MSDKIYFPYETKGGAPSPADTFAKIIDLLRQLEEQCYFLGHLYKEQGDFARGQGMLAIGELFKMTQLNITNLATGKLRKQGGLK